LTRLSWLCFIIVLLVPAIAEAATVSAIIPATAARGARVVVTGTGLEAPELAVAFTDSSGAALPATIVLRTATLLEVSVPLAAVTGPVRVTHGATTVATVSFALAPDPAFARVITLAGSPADQNGNSNGQQDDSKSVFREPFAAAVTLPDGNVYVSDSKRHQIRLVTPSGIVSVVAGTGKAGLTNGVAAVAQFREPLGLALDRDRKMLYIADRGNSAVRKLDLAAGVVSTFAGSTAGDFREPSGVALDAAGNLFVADTKNHRIRKVSPAGAITTVAGGARAGYADGAPAQALFKEPLGLIVFSGVLYVADSGNDSVRRIDLATNTVSTVAGKPQNNGGNSGDGGQNGGEGDQAQATFRGPASLAFDDAGNLYVADQMNHRIRRVDLRASPAAVTTVAGTGKGGFVDGLLANAQLRQPAGVAGEGALYVADSGNDAIRMVVPELKLAAIWPRRGPLTGGNEVRIFGSGFIAGKTEVKIGGRSTAARYATPTELFVTVPAASAATVDVSVTTVAGTATLPAAYVYLPPPAISSVTPRKGSSSGGQSVTIGGANFDDPDLAVFIGPVAVTQVVAGASALTVTTPPGSHGAADVVVRTSAGEARLAGGFLYFDPPVITSVTPTMQFAGDTITVRGRNFDADAGGSVVKIGATDAVVVSATAQQLTLNAPRIAVTGKVSVTTAGGTAQSASDVAVKVMSAIALTPADSAIQPGKTLQYVVEAIDTTGGRHEITAGMAWTSSDSTTATVNAGGLATSNADGTATVSATFRGFNATAKLIVDSKPPQIKIINPNDDLPRARASFEASALATDGDSVAAAAVNGNAVEVAHGFFTASVTLVEGVNTVRFTARDRAGNEGRAEATAVRDSQPPVVAVTAPATGLITRNTAVTVTGTVTDSDAATAFTVNTVSVTLSGGAFTTTVPLSEGPNTISVSASDRARNERRVNIEVTLDTQAPEVELLEPGPATTTNGSTVAVRARVTDNDQVTGATVNGTSVAVTGGKLSTTVGLTDGSNAIRVSADDRAGNTGIASMSVTRFMVPAVEIGSPADLSVLASSTIAVSGTFRDAATVTVNGVAATLTGSTFRADGVPLLQGRTVVTATAAHASGHVAASSVNIYRDAIPPRVVVYAPAEGSIVQESPVTLTGMVDDLVVGTVNNAQVRVTVNGQTAEVSNRAFLAREIALTPGANTIVLTATDQAGNATTSAHHLTLQPASGARIVGVSGNAQTAAIGEMLAAPLVVRLLDAAGNPAAGRPVTFRIVENNGTLTAGAVSGRTVTATTDAQGHASVHWRLGMRSGAGNHRVEATAGGFAGVVELNAVGGTGRGTAIVVDMGDGQYGAIGAPLPRPLIAVVVDAGGNRVAGARVTFSVREGGGSFDGAPAITVTTDSDGRAIAQPSLGTEPGQDNHVFAANIEGTTAGVTFVASGRVAGPATETRISGVVLDNAALPIAGVTLRVEGTTLATTTDANGQFVLASAPVGYVKLIADGSTAQRSGTWPMLEYILHTIPGADNPIGLPIYLLPIDVQRGLVVSETKGGTLTLPELPGFSVTVAPGQVLFPNGSRSGTISATLVHADRMPMTPAFGQQPRFVVTIQPAGAHFDPPAAVTLPNVDGLAPGEITELFSFDHDLGQFVSIGTGSVADDGTLVRSDRGAGLIKAGWMCGGTPQPTGSVSNCGTCKLAQAGLCVINPAPAPCSSDGNPCTEDLCQNGTCAHLPLNSGSKVWIEARYVDRDNTSATWSSGSALLVSGKHLYGGSIRDSARWEARTKTTVAVTGYAWKAVGPQTYAGPASSSWTVDEINWRPGFYNVEVEVTFATGCKVKRVWGQRVGIRTDDITVIAWINEDNVPLNPAGVVDGVIYLFPPTGMEGESNAKKVMTMAYLGSISLGGDARPFSTPDDFLSPADRLYILNWMFKFGGNDQPPFEFANELLLDAFPLTLYRYKLFNRLQVKYLVDAGAITSVTPIRRAVSIGWTVDPITGVLLFPGEAGLHDRDFIVTSNEIHQVNDGTPDAPAVRSFNTLMNPLKWSHIGSKIRFRLDDPEAEVKRQIYPTYFIYKNRILIDIRPQAPNPSEVFSSTPYPPGPPFPPFIYQP
jgi:sugar lactone lactonase YvrE